MLFGIVVHNRLFRTTAGGGNARCGSTQAHHHLLHGFGTLLTVTHVALSRTYIIGVSCDKNLHAAVSLHGSTQRADYEVGLAVILGLRTTEIEADCGVDFVKVFLQLSTVSGFAAGSGLVGSGLAVVAGCYTTGTLCSLLGGTCSTVGSGNITHTGSFGSFGSIVLCLFGSSLCFCIVALGRIGLCTTGKALGTSSITVGKISAVGFARSILGIRLCLLAARFCGHCHSLASKIIGICGIIVCGIFLGIVAVCIAGNFRIQAGIARSGHCTSEAILVGSVGIDVGIGSSLMRILVAGALRIRGGIVGIAVGNQAIGLVEQVVSLAVLAVGTSLLSIGSFGLSIGYGLSGGGIACDLSHLLSFSYIIVNIRVSLCHIRVVHAARIAACLASGSLLVFIVVVAESTITRGIVISSQLTIVFLGALLVRMAVPADVDAQLQTHIVKAQIRNLYVGLVHLGE